MSKKKIKEVAIRHFIEYGYEGTKLAQIAEDVGIRRQTLPYHFATKKILFTEIFKDAVNDEISFIKNYFQSIEHDDVHQVLSEFLTLHKKRFSHNLNTQLMQRVMFLVPTEIYLELIQKPYHYVDALTELLEGLFAKGTFRVTSKECALAFVTLLDGLDILLIYEDEEKYDQLQKISWDIFWTGIQKQ